MLVVGALSLLVVLIDLGISIAATIPGTTPAHIEQVKAGPYHLTISLYTYPARAGYGLPFAVAPMNATGGSLTYDIFSVPAKGVDANPIRATFSADANVQHGIKGAAEVTVQGQWSLQIQVHGDAGQGTATVSFPATALPAVPNWLGWCIGLLPFYVLCGFFLMQMSHNRKAESLPEEHVDTPLARV